MRIGRVSLETPLVLAPMAGVTDRQFRLILRRIIISLRMSPASTVLPKPTSSAISKFIRGMDKAFSNGIS